MMYSEIIKKLGTICHITSTLINSMHMHQKQQNLRHTPIVSMQKQTVKCKATNVNKVWL